MTILTSLVNLRDGICMSLSQIFCMTSGLPLLEDEQKFKLGGRCVGGHEMSISSANMSSICKK
jgi:hypothetical protein